MWFIQRQLPCEPAKVAGLGTRFVLALVIAGCGPGNPSVATNPARQNPAPSVPVRQDQDNENADPYRIRVDVRRGRTWVLERDNVSIYSGADKRLIQRVELPGWNVAGSLGNPDMVIEPSGATLISSNIVPMLWRIDPADFKVARIPITLQTKENWDVGFSGLAFTADGTLFGVTPFAASLWVIKPDEAKALPIALSTTPIWGAHALWVSSLDAKGTDAIKSTLCVATADRVFRIELTADARQGHGSEAPCGQDLSGVLYDAR